MKKTLLLLILIFSMLLSGCGAADKEPEKSEVDQIAGKIENALYEVFGDDLKKISQHELVATIKYGNKNGTGHGINYHIIKSTYFEGEAADITGFNEDAVGVLFHSEAVDSHEEMTIQDWPGALYRVGDLSYLCFTCAPDVTYAFEYDAEEISDDEILKMAERAESVK